MERIVYLLQCCERQGFFQRKWKGVELQETDQEAAIRLFRQHWNGDDFWLELLAAGCGRPMVELVTLGQGTLWVCDEPGGPAEIPLAERKEQFLHIVLGTAYRPLTLAA